MKNLILLLIMSSFLIGKENIEIQSDNSKKYKFTLKSNPGQTVYADEWYVSDDKFITVIILKQSIL